MADALLATAIDIPSDVVQNVVEYEPTLTGVISCRCVCWRWHDAVSDAFGFLNARCWDSLVYSDDESVWDALEDHFGAKQFRKTPKMAALCLRHRLTSFEWSEMQLHEFCQLLQDLRLELLLSPSGTNTTLQRLVLANVRANVSLVVRLQALRVLELTLVPVRNADLDEVCSSPTLTTLALINCCTDVTDFSCVQRLATLRELRLTRASVSTLVVHSSTEKIVLDTCHGVPAGLRSMGSGLVLLKSR
jgi:hypothetical protein